MDPTEADRAMLEEMRLSALAGLNQTTLFAPPLEWTPANVWGGAGFVAVTPPGMQVDVYLTLSRPLYEPRENYRVDVCMAVYASNGQRYRSNIWCPLVDSAPIDWDTVNLRLWNVCSREATDDWNRLGRIEKMVEALGESVEPEILQQMAAYEQMYPWLSAKYEALCDTDTDSDSE